MPNLLAALSLLSLTAWLILLLLPWRPWKTGPVLEEEISPSLIPGEQNDFADITVVIPARNEAVVIAETLRALRMQTGETGQLRVILVDDCSDDGTAEIARSVEGLDLEVVTGKVLPTGWAGKLWALDQGVRLVHTRYTLLLDADIRLAPSCLSLLRRLAEEHQRPFVSVMATLPMNNFWEKLLTPAFIYFFKLLYPFTLANGPQRRFASAAGGCILLRTSLFAQIGGLVSIRSALIDDCALAARVKKSGFRTWTGQSHYVQSGRGYNGLDEIWNMVARSAYTQLLYSPILLALTSLGLIIIFWGPLLGLLAPLPATRWAALVAWLVMALTYLPTLNFYGRSRWWCLLLPLVGALYLAMTWTSAIRYYRGVRESLEGTSVFGIVL